MPTRRTLLAGSLAVLAGPTLAQTGHEYHAPYESLRQPGRISLPEVANQQRVFDSPAPKAANAGRWIERAPLPLPRSEMAWAAEFRGRMHLVGGYGEQRVDRPYHHVYDPARDAWTVLAPLPRGGADHVGVAALGDRLYAVGGFVEQNRNAHAECFAYDPAADRWSAVAPLPRACGAIGCVALAGRLHAIGGAEGTADRRSVSTHLAFDPASDRWEPRAPFITPRDHTAW